MKRTFAEAMENRRTNYTLTDASPIEDAEILEIVHNAVMNVPSAFNSQTTRCIVLFGENHHKVWEITRNILKAMLPAEAFKGTESKIDGCFDSGHGTILFYEDTGIIEALQKQFPTYAENFPIWSMQTSGMHQFAIWTMLADAGLGVNLQHYNPLIDKEVAKAFNVNPNWKLIAEMPFGTPSGKPGEKQHQPLDSRVIAF